MGGCVIVVGCMRSGTSLVSGVLSGLGFVFGGLEPVGGDEHNVRGYFEDSAVNGLLWRVAEGGFSEVPGVGLRGEWEAYLDGVLGLGDGLVGFKDTRMCLGLPWLLDGVLERWPGVRLVFVERDLGSVLDSVRCMQGDSEFWLAKAHAERRGVHESYRLVRGRVPCHWVRFEEFVKRPERQVGRLASFVGLPVSDAALGFFDRGLVHHG